MGTWAPNKEEAELIEMIVDKVRISVPLLMCIQSASAFATTLEWLQSAGDTPVLN